MDPTDEYLTVESAGNAAGISPRTLRYWIKGGKLPATAGPRGKLVRLADVLALADLTGRSSPQAAATRQAAGNPATSARSAGNAADDGDDDAPSVAVSPAARSQLEAIRDEWLAPLVARIEELARENGALRAERDALAAEVARDRGLADQLVDLLQEERDALRWERDRLAAQVEASPPAWRDLAETTAERDTLSAEVDRLQGDRDALVDAPGATGGPGPAPTADWVARHRAGRASAGDEGGGRLRRLWGRLGRRG